MKGWYYENYRHSLAAKGIKTSLSSRRLSMKEGFLFGHIRSGAEKSGKEFAKQYRIPEAKQFMPSSIKYSGLTEDELKRIELLKESLHGAGPEKMVEISDEYGRRYVSESTYDKMVEAKKAQEEAKKAQEEAKKAMIERLMAAREKAARGERRAEIIKLKADLEVLKEEEQKRAIEGVIPFPLDDAKQKAWEAEQIGLVEEKQKKRAELARDSEAWRAGEKARGEAYRNEIKSIKYKSNIPVEQEEEEPYAEKGTEAKLKFAEEESEEAEA